MPVTPNHKIWYTDGSVEMQANTISALEASSVEHALNQMNYDTGWVNLVLATGFQGTGTQGRDGFKYRYKNGIVTVFGGVQKTSGNFDPGVLEIVVTAGTIPPEFRPAENIRGGGLGNGNSSTALTVTLTGAVHIALARGETTDATWVGGSVTYPVDTVVIP